MVDDECRVSAILGKDVRGSDPCGFGGVIGSSIHESKYDDQLSVGDECDIDICLSVHVSTDMLTTRARDLQEQSQESAAPS